MKNDICKEFENKVLSRLEKLTECNHLKEEWNSLRLGVAVSGGADSISLLKALASILCSRDQPLYVISVNHNIRAAEETCGDASYVESFCKKLNESGGNIIFKLVEIQPGMVNRTAEERGAGVEEAARFLRYSAFESFINQNKLDFLCLAHNCNDQAETLLMRFLQGSGVDSGFGIAAKREKYIRPLIEISRTEIEAYLKSQNIQWRTDSTNLDTQYLRNKIRLELMPFLSEKFPGWQNAVLNGGKKALADKNFIEREVEKSYSMVKNGSVLVEDFYLLPEAVQFRILIRMFNDEGCGNRIPYVFLEDVIKQIICAKKFSKQFGGVEIKSDGEKLFVKKLSKTQTDLVFFDIIEESEEKAFPFGVLSVEKNEKGLLLTCNEVSVQLKMDFPICVRNVQMEDFIECKNGTFKKIMDIFSDWKVSEEKRCLIPLIQELNSEKQELKCIFGEPIGFYNWVVVK